MRIFEFTLILGDGIVLSAADADSIFAAGCDDCSPRVTEGVSCIDFDREASNLEEAIHSAISQVRSAGFDVKHVQLEADNAAIAS